jgi:hypothetical protein
MDGPLTAVAMKPAVFLILALGGTKQLWWWLTIISIVTFVGSLLGMPAIVNRLPSDYFARDPALRGPAPHPVLRILRNVFGLALVLGGIAMLVLPGQGLLTILIGLGLMDFPGKWRLMRWFVGRPGVLKALNWIRRRGNKPPMMPPGPLLLRGPDGGVTRV